MKQDLKGRYGSWGLIAGAAEGLGRAYAEALAEQGLNLILVDQQKEQQEELAGRLESAFGIQVLPLHLDLASAGSVGKIMEVIQERSCRLIIYNAALSRVQKFVENDPDMLDRYVQVNIRTPLQLVHGFCGLHHKETDPRKGIILMSSLAGSWGTQLLSPYGGSKAFNHNLAESLHYELKDEGFDVLACIAGPTSTPGYIASLPQGKVKTISVMHPDAVVEAGLRGLGRKPFVVAGFRNKLIYVLMSRILPRRMSLRIMNRAVGKLYSEKT
jgi:short-subunit dehydrogenase